MGIVNVPKLVLSDNKFVLKTVNNAQRDALTGMVKGTIIFNTEDEVMEFWDGNEWTQAYRPVGDLVYEFNNFTFQSGLNRGEKDAPSSSSFAGIYSSQNWYSQYFSADNSGNQYWQIPGAGTYRITAGGARGGRDNNYGQSDIYGATIRGDFDLEAGTTLAFRIGSGGNQYWSPHGNEAGGGGGTYVHNSTAGTLLLVAGGGGGSAGNVYGNSCSRNTTTASGQTTQQAGITTCQGNYTAPTPSIQYGGSGSGSYWGGGGGGYIGNGSNGYNHCGTPTGGRSYQNGSQGGPGDGCYTGSGQGNRGGFGGGGGGNLSGPGGAGGYTGGTSSGAWSSYSQHGGGGGSFNGGSNQNNVRGGNSSSNGGYGGAGFVTVQLLL